MDENYVNLMLHVGSPWLYELQKHTHKPFPQLDTSGLSTDVVIIGGGIAGIITAYYILEHTRKKVILVEGNHIASGATGHNAGQLVGYFERPFHDIVKQYGTKLATEAQLEINKTWESIEEIKEKIDLKTPVSIFQGLSGCTSFKPVYNHLKNRFLRPEITHQEEFCLIANDCEFLDKIPSDFKDLYTVVPRKIILDYLETTDTKYCALFTAKKGVMNSAQFCYELVAYLLKHHGKRFSVFEHTLVSEILLDRYTSHVITQDGCKINTIHVVLCTNGFRHIKIINRAGETINADYHESVHGKVGFMKAYTFRDEKQPIAISYYDANDDEYFYLTRRNSKVSDHHGYNLVSVGGPEHFLADRTDYHYDRIYPDFVLKEIDKFVHKTRINEFKKHYEHAFIWHGLMGYTKNQLRIIGPDKYNPLLLYNLGCNGVGILPSLYGGKKISLYLQNKVSKKSIFDPYF